MADTLASSKFKVKIDSKEYANCSGFTPPRISIAPVEHRDDDGKKGVTYDSGNVSVSSVTIRKPFDVGDSTLIDWIDTVKQSGCDGNKKTIGVTVFDNADNAKLEVTLNNAWPSDYGHTQYEKDGNARVMEEVTLVVEDAQYKTL